jgi:hypothetical protein
LPRREFHIGLTDRNFDQSAGTTACVRGRLKATGSMDNTLISPSPYHSRPCLSRALYRAYRCLSKQILASDPIVVESQRRQGPVRTKPPANSPIRLASQVPFVMLIQQLSLQSIILPLGSSIWKVISRGLRPESNRHTGRAPWGSCSPRTATSGEARGCRCR